MRKRPFGRTAEGRAVEQVVLQSPEGRRRDPEPRGGGARLADRRAGGQPADVLGFPTVEAYERHARSHGAICGRMVNRIKDARLTLDGKEYLLVANEGPNQLHGGPEGSAAGSGRWRSTGRRSSCG